MNQQDSLFQEPGGARPEKATSTGTGLAADSSEDLPTQVKTLQHQFNTLLILLLVVSGTLSLYLLREMNMARKDLAVLKAQAQPVIADYNERTAPAMQQFLGRLGEYASTHPDVLPILSKYGLTRPATNTGAAPAIPATAR